MSCFLFFVETTLFSEDLIFKQMREVCRNLFGPDVLCFKAADNFLEMKQRFYGEFSTTAGWTCNWIREAAVATSVISALMQMFKYSAGNSQITKLSLLKEPCDKK